MRSTLAAPIGLLSLIGSVMVALPATAEPATELFLSEYIEGSSYNKAIEVYNGTGADVDLAPYVLTQYSNGNTSASLTLDLTGTLAAGDVYVVAHSSADPAILAQADLTTGAGLFNGDDALVLSKDGVTVDAFGQVGVDPGSEWVGGGANDTLRRLPGICTGDTDETNAFDASVEWEAFASDTFDGLGSHTATCTGDGGDGGDGETPTVAAIHDVQGAGASSPMVGELVTVEGIVVGDYEGPSPALRGFYLQQSDATVDADPATSEGIFVFNYNNDDVDLGDVVELTGTVGEYQGQTQISSVTALAVVDTGATVTPATVTLPFASADAAEAFEGMLVTFPQDLYVTEYYQQGRSGEVVLSSGARLQQPTAVAAPGAPAQAIQAANDLNRITIDDATNAQNADPIFGGGGNPLTASNPLRGGDTVTDLVGVMTYTWGGYSSSPNAYRVRPVGDLSDTGLVPGGVVPVFAAANPRPTEPEDVGGSLKVASFNVLNYFLTLDSSGNQCGPVGYEDDCRGAETTEEFERQRTKLLEALQALDADVIALMEMENTPGVDPAADLAAGLNAAQGITGWESIDTGVLGTDVIRVGLIFRGDLVRPSGDFTVMDSSVDPRFDDTRNRPSLAQTFVQMNGSEHVTLVVNHLKSKGSCPGDGSADDNAGDGAACWNATRTAAAEALVDWIDAGQAGNGDPDVVVMGDLNAYAKEDPIQTFIDAGYADLSLGNYSYVFDGQWGYLDYALASPSLQPQVTGVTEFHINADEVPVLDYNTNYQSPAQIALLYAPDMYRTSDHDPILLGLDLDSGVTFAVTPDVVTGPEHSLVDVDVTAAGPDSAPWTVEIINAFSTQADDGMAAGDLPGDATIVDGDTARFRAEEYGADERVYVMYVEAVGPNGERVYRALEVPVEVEPAAPTCSVQSWTHSWWGGGFVTTMLVRNLTDERINGWTLDYDMSPGARIWLGWNGNITQTGNDVSVSNAFYNSTIWPGSARSFGYLGTHRGSAEPVGPFMLNGQQCEVIG
ncbi:ExeM/NucH family extracellular endonuclease [Demequina sp.]|uniref:ExeM/NucH family extracellular endonuclease n=1 Tax=Demequina sp. TaxID=2050685 RepID=UPI0025BB90C4|nr:ExeM/NucH family extracellular endonuclease [Demequina sp.]